MSTVDKCRPFSDSWRRTAFYAWPTLIMAHIAGGVRKVQVRVAWQVVRAAPEVRVGREIDFVVVTCDR